MLKSRTIIGIVVGSIIIALGGVSLVTSFGLQQVDFDDNFAPGESTTFNFFAPKNSAQWINITGDSFHVDLRSPRGGIQIEEEDFTKELTIEWRHLIDGETTLKINNTGNDIVNAKGYFHLLTDPIQFTFHILVLTSGVIIIGFSAGFSVRKPRGF